MFGSKKTVTTSITSKYASHISTMQKDLSGDVPFKSTPEFSTPLPNETRVDDTNSKPPVIEKAPNKNESKDFSQSPFLASQPITSTNTAPVTEQKKPLPSSAPSQTTNNHAPSEFVPVETLRTPSHKLNWYKIMIATISFCIIAVAAFAGYYFFITKKPAPPIEESTTQTTPQNQEVVINPVLEKFSANKPNYLMMDMSDASPEKIWGTIAETSAEIKEAGSSSSFEFIITDANNTPVSFPIFAIAAKIDLPQDILKSLGEKFSLFLKNDDGGIRVALAIPILNETNLKTDILKQEPSLQKGLSALFLENKPETTKAEFTTGAYGAIPTRYLNFSPDGNLSIDYSVTGNILYFGTSKNVLRSAIDKYAQETAISDFEKTD